jgi:predicted transcriptional regulator
MKRKARLKALELLHELSMMSTKHVNLSQIAREYGVSRQYIHRLIKNLVEKGFVVKTGEGYKLSEKGLWLISNAPEEYKEYKLEVYKLKIYKLENILQYYDNIIARLLKSEEKIEEIDYEEIKWTRDHAMTTFLIWLITFCLEAVLEANIEHIDDIERLKTQIEKKLDKLWNDKYKALAVRLAILMLTYREDEWKLIEALLYFIYQLPSIIYFLLKNKLVV